MIDNKLPALTVPVADDLPTLKRIIRLHGDRRTLWLVIDWQRTPLSDVLHMARRDAARRVFILGGETADLAPPRTWWAAVVGEGWEMGDYHQESRRRGASYRRPGDSAAVDVWMGAQWFPGCRNAGAAALAWTQLGGLLRGTFDRNAVLMGSPARTGLDLVERSLPEGATYPILPHQELHDLLHEQQTQGRNESVQAPGAVAPDGLWWYDMQWAYAACMAHLPAGPYRWDSDPDYEGFTPGFYRVRWQAPVGWHHIGLIPLRPVGDEGWTWPAGGDAYGESWITGAEYLVALAPFPDVCDHCKALKKAGGDMDMQPCPDHSWPMAIQERLLWPHYTSPPWADPARVFVRSLRTLRDRERSPLLRDALRSVLLGAVGSWHQRSRARVQYWPIDQEANLPAEAWGQTYLPDLEHATTVKFYTGQPLDAALEPHRHPEWSATVWGRARARLNRAALRLNPGTIAWLRSDAIVTTCAVPWMESEHPAVGEFRQKLRMPAVREIPTDEGAYVELLGEGAE